MSTNNLNQPARRSLYICYFGLREPLVQTQVLPYLRHLCLAKYDIHLLTYEPTPLSTSERIAWTNRLKDGGIHWHSLKYHKRPSLPATVYDIFNGARFGSHLVRKHNIDLVHGRAHVGAAIGLLIKRATGAKLLFDIRGFNPEEYVDAGIWSETGLKFMLTKRAERRILQAADGFVILTDCAKEILFPSRNGQDKDGRPVEVIPCCVDMKRFGAESDQREKIRKQLGLNGKNVLVYVGALGGFYLTDKMAELLAFAKSQDEEIYALVLTQSDPELIRVPLRKYGFPEADVFISHVAPEQIPYYLLAADAAISLIKPSFSKKASSPTKLAEYLASGLPVICNAGIGDLDALFSEEKIGVLLPDLTTASFDNGIRQLRTLRGDQSLKERCITVARNRFGLSEVGGQRYERIYDFLMRESVSEP